MISLSQQELREIEDQITMAMFKALEKVNEGFKNAVLDSPHWVSHFDAIEKLGWAKILLKKGVSNGHLHPITFPGSGGTKYDLKELTEYKAWLMAERRANKLHPEYVTTSLAQSIPDDYVLPNNSQKGSPRKNGLPHRRKSAA